MPKDEPKDPGSAPAEDRKRGMAITLPSHLDRYVCEISRVTGVSQATLKDRIGASEHLAKAVRLVCSAVVDDHVRSIQAHLKKEEDDDESAPPTA